MPLCTAAIQPGAIGASLGIEPFTPSVLSTPSLAGPGPAGSPFPAGSSFPGREALSAVGQDPAALPATALTAANGIAANEIGVPAGDGLLSPGGSAAAPPPTAPSLPSPPSVPALPGSPPAPASAPGAGPGAAPWPSSPAAPPPPALTAPAGPEPDGAGPLATLIGDR